MWRSRLGSSFVARSLAGGVWVGAPVREWVGEWHGRASPSFFPSCSFWCSERFFFSVGRLVLDLEPEPGFPEGLLLLLMLDARCSVVGCMHARVHMHMLVRIYILSNCPLFPPPLPFEGPLLTSTCCVRRIRLVSRACVISLHYPLLCPSPSPSPFLLPRPLAQPRLQLRPRPRTSVPTHLLPLAGSRAGVALDDRIYTEKRRQKAPQRADLGMWPPSCPLALLPSYLFTGHPTQPNPTILARATLPFFLCPLRRC